MRTYSRYAFAGFGFEFSQKTPFMNLKLTPFLALDGAGHSFPSKGNWKERHCCTIRGSLWSKTEGIQICLLEWKDGPMAWLLGALHPNMQGVICLWHEAISYCPKHVFNLVDLFVQACRMVKHWKPGTKIKMCLLQTSFLYGLSLFIQVVNLASVWVSPLFMLSSLMQLLYLRVWNFLHCHCVLLFFRTFGCGLAKTLVQYAGKAAIFSKRQISHLSNWGASGFTRLLFMGHNLV